MRFLASTVICKFFKMAVLEINKITLEVMNSSSPFVNSFTLRNHWGSNISPSKNGITIVFYHLAHALACRTGGLVIMRHNKIRDEHLYISQRASTPVLVCAEPLIIMLYLIRTRDMSE